MSASTPLLIIVGPTGSGKTDLALELAETFRGEIVNCDSLQLYRRLNIGTAKVPVEERRGIPHHLLDLLEPDDVFTAGDYARLARPLLKEITARVRLPVIAGGTGFYLRALMDGLFEGPSRDNDLRSRLAKRPASLHRMLRRWDPAAADRVHPNDTNKLIRALEVCLLARRPLSELHHYKREPLKGYAPLKIGLSPPRQQLYARLNARCARMFEQGLVEEVRQVLALGFPEDSKALEAIGYQEALLFVRGAITLEDAIEAAQTSTRHYAKRQMTWFRREPGVIWLSSFGNQTETIEKAKSLVEKFLK
ncbi:MAG: tRNA (adenosine(37)-N6)-dimethylallyltransferase MiaA [Bryobacteraceae bacterium]